MTKKKHPLDDPPHQTTQPKSLYQRGRATYDISQELKEEITKYATRLGIPASQLAHFLLTHAMILLENKTINPKPYIRESDSPRFRNKLDIDQFLSDLNNDNQ